MPAWLVLSLVLALTLAAVYQLVHGRLGWWLLVYWFCILLGFLGAEIMVENLGWNLTRVGDLRIGPDILGALTAVFLLWRTGL